ncbi:Ca2-permeable cation channel OSM-9 and related channels (OTRPC family) [Phytophthora cinnamomi]|uniref:Ca2-permeable cation channel OSM-9 and related channels (OTRPC family) n=1 Tax=Phytophthora cinnamomi TaxID=4785 RepID=UPI00355A983B|nr:Ca2-permeable cation channel OSM-9 and related channels (OTRPC family) [Phytophthora cinnamomi]
MEDSARRLAVPAMPPGAPAPRDKVMEDYRAHVKESRAYKKKHHKQVILEDVRKRPPRLQLRHEHIRAQHTRPHPNSHTAPQPRKSEIKESPTRMMQGGNYLRKLLAGQFGLGQDERPEGWAAAKINRAMRRYYRMNLLLEKRDKQHLALQSKLLFDECCRCRPLIPGPMTTESGVLRLAEPNLPKILRILRNEANDGLDLLQPHGLAQYTAMHVAAQRGYTDLVTEGGHLTLCKLLLANGANINAQNKSGETPLHFAIASQRHGVCIHFVENHADVRISRHSPTLWLIVQTECKELIFHPWFRQLLDHKWNSFTRQTFRSEFKVYLVYFVAVFIATYLRIGDTFVGMPLGGYRNNIFNEDVGYMEYVRDAARLVYFGINTYYTHQEFQSYRECGSLRVYLRDEWNWFDVVQISCVWLLLVADVLEMISPEFDQEDFRLIVYQESLYSFNIRRRYNFRITLMAIVGPQIFVKWIQFARGTRTLGPFVRMIAKMFSDILVFMMVFCVFLGGFAFAFFILQLEGCKSYFAALTTTFNISLGSWDWDSIYEGGLLAILLFLCFVTVGTIMLLNLLIAMMGNTYDKVWEDRLLFFELERAKATLSIQMSLDDEVYDEKHWCPRLYALEGDTPIEGIQFHRL